MNLNRYFCAGLLLLALAAVSCKEEPMESGPDSENVISIVIGNDDVSTKSAGASVCTGIQVASYDFGVKEEEGLSLVETVSSIDEVYSELQSDTKGTPVYTENFDALYGEKVYATAYEPVSGSGVLTDVWGSYLENGGTVKFSKTAANTYSYDYSKGQAVSLSWPDGGELLYFIQAPYDKTKSVSPLFYADGHIEFDYTDPTTPTEVEGRNTIVDGAASQSDLLFTSKNVRVPAAGAANQNRVLMYHALTAVKFKAGNEDMEVTTTITKVTLKGLKANGHCTITPSYGSANLSPENPSNASGADASKSKACSKWTKHSKNADLVVDYSQTFSGVVNYTGSENFAESFYDGSSNVKNLGKADGSEIMLMVPQPLEDIEVVVDFKINDKPYTRSVKMSGEWKAGELHTYTLVVNKVDVAIEDSMNEALTEKTGVTTKNTGNVTAYLRATYALAWYYGYDNDAICVAAYQGNGEFSYLGGPNDKDGYKLTWIKGSDGFYYYTWPVMPGRATRFPFFGSFTAPSKTETGPFIGSHLEMNILLQGVQYDEDKALVTRAWGDVYTVDDKGIPTSTKIVDVLSDEIENLNR